MKYKWLLRGGRMQRIKFPDTPGQKRKKSKPKGNGKIGRRIKHNTELIKIRKTSELSNGESKIAEFLKSNLIEFEREYAFKTCFNPKTNKFLFFDFWLPDYKMVIEFDGIYHYEPLNGKKALAGQKEKDLIKNKFCKKNGIKILRIPYWRFKKIEFIICQYFDNHF